MKRELYNEIYNTFINCFQSIDEVKVEYNKDRSGGIFFGGGLLLDIIVNNHKLETEFDFGMCDLFCGEYDNWDEACEEMLTYGLNDIFYNYEDEFDSNTIETATEILKSYFKFSLNKFEKIAKQNRYDLDKFIRNDDEDD